MRPRTSYTFAIRAKNSAGESAEVTVPATTAAAPVAPPAAPSGLLAPAAETTSASVGLTWTAAATDADISAYQVQVSDADGAMVITAWTNILGSTASTTSYTVTGLTAETAYTFAIRARNSAGESAEVTVTATTKAAPTAPSFGSETIANQTYAVSTEITPLALPEAMGGMPPLTYSLAPVPADLSFDPASRMLSGTPSAEQTATEHTYTVTDSASTPLTVTLTFTITVNAAGTPTFMGTIKNQTYTKDTAIMNLVLPAATGGMGPYTYTLDPVPAGLSFDSASRTLSGTPTVDAAIATHTYTVADSTTGTALEATLTFSITVSEAEEPTFGIGSQGAVVHVYPNPVGDVLHIEFPGAGEYGIALLTVTGQPVFGGQQVGGGTRKLDVSTLKGGVYFLKIEDSEGVSQTFRIIR